MGCWRSGRDWEALGAERARGRSRSNGSSSDHRCQLGQQLNSERIRGCSSGHTAGSARGVTARRVVCEGIAAAASGTTPGCAVQVNV